MQVKEIKIINLTSTQFESLCYIVNLDDRRDKVTVRTDKILEEFIGEKQDTEYLIFKKN